MGNATCCAGNTGRDAKCCMGQSGIVEPLSGVGAPTGPLPTGSNEASAATETVIPRAIAKIEVEGDQRLLEPGETRQEDPCPGGDSAAGGHASAPDKQEHQHVTYEDGSTYTGQIVNGKRQGQGMWQSRTGKYEGQWKADAQHGHGRQTWSDGRVYEGQFQLGRFSGTGRMVWHTQKGQLIYEGQYQDDLKHGHGKFVWADGRVYDGEWMKGKRHGRGIYVNARQERKVGFWVDDKFDRWDMEDAEDGDNRAGNSRAAPPSVSGAGHAGHAIG